MSEQATIVIALLGLLGSILGFAGVIIGLRTKAAVTSLKVDVDGRLSALLEITGLSEHAKGVIEGTRAEVARAGHTVTPDG